MVNSRDSLILKSYACHILELHNFSICLCFNGFMLRNKLTTYICSSIWENLPIKDICSKINCHHLACSKENYYWALNKSAFLSLIKLFFNELWCFTKFYAVRKNWFIPSFFKLWILIQQIKDSFALNLHYFSISHCFNVCLTILLIYEIMWINYTANTFCKWKIIKLLLDWSSNNKIHIFHVFIFCLYCCTLSKQSLIWLHSNINNFMSR